MSFPAMRLTNAGKQIIVKSLSGECAIVFTKVGIGNGNAPANPQAETELQNIVKSISVSSITSGSGCATLTVTFDNAEIESGFWWTEIGVFATDPDDGEVLYAYAHAGDFADHIPAYSAQTYYKNTLNVTVVVGETENVSAVIGENIGYATKEALDNHTGDTNNPHQTTKAQVGLSNVPNVTTNNQIPTYTEASTVQELVSGEKLSVAFGKIKKAISAIISHLRTTGNPHGTTADDINAAKKNHTHSTTDLTTGVLGFSRGGTGVSSKNALLELLGLPIETLTYSGDGSRYQYMYLGFTPKAVIVSCATNTDPLYSGIAVNGRDSTVNSAYGVQPEIGSFEPPTLASVTPFYRIALATNGFYVYYDAGQGSGKTNAEDEVYNVIAIK